jgi:hypothetical protein
MSDTIRGVLSGCLFLCWAMLLAARHLSSAIMSQRFDNYSESYNAFYNSLFPTLGLAQWLAFLGALIILSPVVAGSLRTWLKAVFMGTFTR